MADVRLPAELDVQGNVAENFKKFKQNFEIFLIASGRSGKTDAEKVATLLNIIGESGVELYNNFNLSEENKKNYDMVMAKFEEYANPKKNEVYERFVFFERKQGEKEPFNQFYNDLLTLSSTCGFGDQKSKLIRDAIVLRINDKRLQEKLLTIEDIKLEQAVKLCRAHEIMQVQIEEIQEKGKEVNFIKSGRQRNFRSHEKESKKEEKVNSGSRDKVFKCFRCQRVHGVNQCKAYGQTCRKCGLKNHFAIACRVKQTKEVKSVEEDEAEEFSIDSVESKGMSNNKYYVCEVIDRDNKSKLMKKILIKGNNVEFKVDTGSDVNIIPFKIYKKYLSNYELSESNLKLKAYGGFSIKPKGEVKLNCKIRGKRQTIDFIVADVNSVPILGFKTCIDLGYVQVNSITSEDRKTRIITKYDDVFTGLGIMKKEISKIASSRLQRMRIKLLKYDIDLVYVPGPKLYIADLYSRSFSYDKVEDDKELVEIVHLVEKYLNATDDRRQEIIDAVSLDTTMKQLIEYAHNGWPVCYKKLPKDLKVYWPLRGEILHAGGLLFLGNRLIVPYSMRSEMLRILHKAHFGITKTLLKAKESLYWPNMVKDITDYISKCRICETYRPKLCKEPMISHSIPNGPFQKLASDIFEFEGNNYLVLFDYFSRWLEVVKLKNKTAGDVNRAFMSIFAVHGFPLELIADNMPYNSYECRQFAEKWNFKITTSSPRYPKSNGLAEKGVGISKNILRKCQDLNLGLLEYRTTPVLGIGLSPAEILMGRKLKSVLPITTQSLTPKPSKHEIIKSLIEEKRLRDKISYDKSSKVRNNFEENENILIREGNTWVGGKINEKLKQPRSYNVVDTHGNQYRRNSYFLRGSKNEFSIPKGTEFAMDIPESHSSTETSVSKNVDLKGCRVRKLPSRFNDFEMY